MPVLINDALKKIKRFEARASNLPWLNAGVHLKISINKNFDIGGRYNASDSENSGGPNKWVPRKKNYDHPTLKKSGRLKLNNSVRLIQNGVAVENRGLLYNAVHNYGFEKRNIPRRPYLVAQEVDIRNITNMFEIHILS